MNPGLLPLSLRRVRLHGKSVPRPPTNEERVAAFRAYRRPELGNAYPWPHRQARAYEREAIADAAPSTADYLEEV